MDSLRREAIAIDPKHLGRTFVLDHYYLPWKHAGEERPSDSQTPRTFPGVLVFRSTPPREEKPPAPPHTLIVFLIGDAPIGGFTSGLWKRLSTSWPGSPTCSIRLRPELRIIGPVFSGSQFSLQTALQLWWTKNNDSSDRRRDIQEPDRWAIEVIGTATAFQFDAFKGTLRCQMGSDFSIRNLAP